MTAGGNLIQMWLDAGVQEGTTYLRNWECPNERTYVSAKGFKFAPGTTRMQPKHPDPFTANHHHAYNMPPSNTNKRGATLLVYVLRIIFVVSMVQVRCTWMDV